MENTNKSKTPILALILSVLLILFVVFIFSQRGGEVDGGYGDPAEPAIDAPERITDEMVDDPGREGAPETSEYVPDEVPDAEAGAREGVYSDPVEGVDGQ